MARAQEGAGEGADATGIRAVEILAKLSECQEPMTIQEVMASLGLRRTTAYRLLKELADAGWVVVSGRPKRFTCSSRVTLLGLQVLRKSRACEVALANAIEYVRATGNSCSIGVYERGDAVYFAFVLKVGGRITVQAIPSTTPATTSGSGKILLAHQPQEEIEAVLCKGLVQWTARTKTARNEVLQELADARKNGFATGIGEYVETSKGMAVPVFNAEGGAVCAIGTDAVPWSPTDEQIRELADGLRVYSERASAELGYIQRSSRVAT